MLHVYVVVCQMPYDVKDRAEPRPKSIFLTPKHHKPTGRQVEFFFFFYFFFCLTVTAVASAPERQ